MLVALIKASWTEDQQNTIKNKRVALAKAQGQQLRPRKDIELLAQDEPLWLYSHGSDTTFAGMVADELAGWLLTTVKMPKGKRQVILKGCRTAGYAASLQEIITAETGYEEVVVLGFEGEASQTKPDGEMLVRLGDEKEKKKAKQRAALADLKARQQLTKLGVSKKEIDKRATATRDKTERKSRTYSAVLDEGSSTFVAKDERMERRLNRNSAKDTQLESEAPEKETVTADTDSDEESMEF